MLQERERQRRLASCGSDWIRPSISDLALSPSSSSIFLPFQLCPSVPLSTYLFFPVTRSTLFLRLSIPAWYVDSDPTRAIPS